MEHSVEQIKKKHGAEINATVSMASAKLSMADYRDFLLELRDRVAEELAIVEYNLEHRSGR